MEGGGRGVSTPPQLEPSAKFGAKSGALWGYSGPKNPKILLFLAAQPKASRKFHFLAVFRQKTSIFGQILAQIGQNCAHIRRIFCDFSNNAII